MYNSLILAGCLGCLCPKIPIEIYWELWSNMSLNGRFSKYRIRPCVFNQNPLNLGTMIHATSEVGSQGWYPAQDTRIHVQDNSPNRQARVKIYGILLPVLHQFSCRGCLIHNPLDCHCQLREPPVKRIAELEQKGEYIVT
ncbi:hypothetical protein FKM82_001768 [Ascaphus truei]